MTDVVHPYLKRNLRSEAQAKRDRHAARWQKMQAMLAPQRLCLEDVYRGLRDCLSVHAAIDCYDFCPAHRTLPWERARWIKIRAWHMKEVRKDFLKNLKLCKGDVEEAISHTMLDAETFMEGEEAEAERLRDEEYKFQQAELRYLDPRL